MNRFGWLALFAVIFVLASSIASADSGTYEHNAQHRLDRLQKYGDNDMYPRYYGNGYSNNYEYEYYFDDDNYWNDYYWRDYSDLEEVYDTDDLGDYESFYWFKKNREYEYERFVEWFADEHPWIDTEDDRWEGYLESWWEDNWDGYIYSRSHDTDYRDYDYYDNYDSGCRYHSDSDCRERVRVYVDRYYEHDNYYSSRCGYKYDYYDSYCRNSRSYDWCNDGYYARKYSDQVWYVQECGRVLED
jgi:hypothetical protein